MRWPLALLVAAAIVLPAAASAATGGLSPAGSPAAEASQAGEGMTFATPMRPAGATWYGPGLYGNRTACGQVLRPRTVGVAHRSLPCGTTVKFSYRGRQLVTTVIDRGPYAHGKAWDLTNGARLALRFQGSGRVRYALALADSGRRR